MVGAERQGSSGNQGQLDAFDFLLVVSARPWSLAEFSKRLSINDGGELVRIKFVVLRTYRSVLP